MIVATLAIALLGQEKFSMMNRPLIPWSARAVDGRQISDRSLRGTSNVLFIFCSCIECRRVAEDWASVRKKGTLTSKSFAPNRKAPRSTVVYVGAAASATKFAKDFGIPSSNVIADPDGAIAAKYRAMPCPTVIVSDTKGVVRYSSKEVAGELVSDSDVLVGQTLTALRHIVSRPNTAVVRETLVPAVSTLLTPVKADGLRVETTGEVVLDSKLGPSQTLVQRRFTFVNKSKAYVDIENLLTSCGCQRASLIYEGKEVARARVKPGNSVTVDVRVDLPHGQDSRNVSVWLYSKAIMPVATIRINVSRPKDER